MSWKSFLFKREVCKLLDCEHKNKRPCNSERSSFYCRDCSMFVKSDGTTYFGEWD